jgi:predicted transcriptional regulator of viral defense system
MASLQHRIVILAGQKFPVFHAQDLARLWNIQNDNTLYTILKRYTQKKLLHRLYKGLYSLHPLETLDPLMLGTKLLHGYTYISMETVLFQHGLIHQVSPHITIAGSRSRRVQLGKYSYIFRKLKSTALHNPLGIEEKNGVFIATPERAAADLWYFNPQAYIDEHSRLDMKKIRTLQKLLGYPLHS